MTVIEVFADITCPFTHAGLRRFVDHRRAVGRPDVALRVRAWPLELVNGVVIDPHHTAEVVDALRRQIAPELFAGFSADVLPTSSIPALSLVAGAYRESLVVGERVSLELRDLLFERGVDIADPGVLDDVASTFGVRDRHAAGAVGADHLEGVERGVIGSPHFFTPQGGFFCPALDIRRDVDGRLLVEPDAAGFGRFVAACFA